MRLTETSLLAILSLLLAACTAAGLPTPEPVVDSKVSIPTPASTIIGRFVWQIDGLCGYQMLRPESWTAAAADCRVYRPPGPQGQNNRLTLRVVNYQLMAEQKTGGLIAQFELFRTDPSLEGWTKGMEQTWQDNGIKSALETTLSRAKIYSLQSPGSPDLQLAALVIDQKQPWPSVCTLPVSMQTRSFYEQSVSWMILLRWSAASAQPAMIQAASAHRYWSNETANRWLQVTGTGQAGRLALVDVLFL